MNLLELKNISKVFGGVHAVEDFSFSARKGKVYGLIGPNGAGKSTVFNIVTGFLKPDKGSVVFRGRDITKETPDAIARQEIGRLFQEVRIFRRLSVLENVLLATNNNLGESPVHALLARRSVRLVEDINIEKAMHWLHFVGLDDRSNSLAEDLSYGQQKLLGIARLLASDAKILLLDEPTAGVYPGMAKRILDLIRTMASDQKTIVIIEHNLPAVMSVSHWILLMASGRIAAFGHPEEIKDDPILAEVYLGHVA